MAKRDKSIVQKDMTECYLCRKLYNKRNEINLHTHEIFFGTANRKKSIEWHLYVRLCGYHHNQSNDGVHYNIIYDLELKRDGQRAFEDLYGHDKFMIEFHKNYL